MNRTRSHSFWGSANASRSPVFFFVPVLALALGLSLALLPACLETDDKSGEPLPKGGLNEPCRDDGSCLGGLTCKSGYCHALVSDGDSESVGLQPFGATCVSDQDCVSAFCATYHGFHFCSIRCLVDDDCTASPGACCDQVVGACLAAPLCTADGDGEAVACEPDTKKCLGNEVLRCDTNGFWISYRDCGDESKLCRSGDCVAEISDGDAAGEADQDEECALGERRCGAVGVERCEVRTGWTKYQICTESQICRNSQCLAPLGAECAKDSECEKGTYCLFDHYQDEGQAHCFKPCDLDNPCPRGRQCVDRRCEVISGYCRVDNDCDTDSFCNKLPAADDGQCTHYCMLLGQMCPENYYCSEDPVNDPQNYGRCVPRNPECKLCSDDKECETDQYCELLSTKTEGCCRDQCTTQQGCVEPLVCNQEGRCVSALNDCTEACPSPYVCDPLFKTCMLSCPTCPENTYCDATTAPDCVKGQCTNPTICGLLLQSCCYGYTCSAVVYGVVGYCL